MTSFQRACAVGAVLWLLSHGPLPALIAWNVYAAPWLSLAAVVLVVAVSVLLLRPLRGGPSTLHPLWAVAAAAVLPLSGLAVMPQLDPDQWRTFANWWPGATQVIAVALVVRRQWPAAVAGELASLAVLALGILASGLPDAAVSIAALNQPAILWLSAAIGVRTLLDRAARDVARYTAEAGEAVARKAATQARASSDRQRRDDLDARAVPLLQDVAATDPSDPQWSSLSRAALSLERQLRDDLRARVLLDDGVRTALRAARSRGAVVDVVDDRPAVASADDFVRALRPVAAAAATACGTAHLTVRLTPAPGHATLALDGTADEAAAVARAVAPAADGLLFAVDVIEGSLWMDLRRPTS